MSTEQERKLWAEEYLATPDNELGWDSALIRRVESDNIDRNHIEAEVQSLTPTIEINGAFCGKCGHLLDHWPDMSGASCRAALGRSFGSICEIEAAARAGCKFCVYLFWRLIRARLMDTFRKIESRLLALGHDRNTWLSIQNRGRGSVASQLLWLNFPAKMATHCGSLGSEAFRFDSCVEDPPANMWQQKTYKLELVRMWLRECSDSHEWCRNKNKYSWPARLLSFDARVARVVPTANFSVMPQYATLSYCWGLEPFTRLTVDKMDTLRQGIAICDMPRVFRDAIHVARTLGLSYIWIDALCIIQQGDGGKDWLTESALMASVYGNCCVNLAATSAINVHEGLYSKPEGFSNGFCARVTTAEHCVVRSFFELEVYDSSSRKTHLATRAWTFQERLLPARNVFLGDNGVVWECRSIIKSECMPNGFPILGGTNLARPEHVAWPWDTIVDQYSRANLTKPRDRLPALAGVARRQHEATGHRYLAGMWAENLITQLPWVVDGERRKRPAWRAPSWSWASVDSGTLYWSYWNYTTVAPRLKHYARVLDAWTTPSRPDPFGQVSNGLVALACSALVRAQLLEDNGDTVRLKCGNIKFPVSLDVLEDERTGNRNDVYLLPLFSGPLGNAQPLSRTLYKGKYGGDQKRWTTEKNEIWNHYNDEEDPMMIRGLVLRACGEDADNKSHFRRIGSFCFEDFPTSVSDHEDDAGKGYCHDFIRVLDEGLAEVVGAQGSGTRWNSVNPEPYIHITIE